MVVEERVLQRVAHDQRRVAVDRVRAERGAAGPFGGVEPDAGLEPLPVAIDEGDQDGRRLNGDLGQPGDPVERFLGRAVEDIVAVEGIRAPRAGLVR
jgi:hypothetical protein